MVRLRADASPFNREMLKARAAVAGLRDDIDSTNDRTAWLAQGFLALAPALVPLGAAAVPVLAGIATQAGVATLAVGTMALAFNGIGDGLKALNDYQLEPTAKNFQKLQIELENLGPDGANFVRFLDDVGGRLSVLSMDARAGMFPGMIEGIESALRLLPRMRTLVTEIAQGIGQLSAEAGENLAGPKFEEFFDYLQSDAKPLLLDMGHTLGNFFDGFTAMIEAFAPVTADFSRGMVEMSESFADWAHGLDSSETFQDFLQYVRESGPQAMDLLGALADAFVQIVEAAAPIGSAALPVLTKFFEIVGAIADTPVGSLLVLTAALTSVFGRVKALGTITSGPVFGRMTTGFRESADSARKSIPTFRQLGSTLAFATHSNDVLKKSMLSNSKVAQDTARNAFLARSAVRDFGRAATPAAASGALLALSMTGVADSAGLGNAALGGMVGLMTTGGPWGLAIGTAIGLAMDFEAANDDLEAAIRATNTAMDTGKVDQMTVAMRRLQEQVQSTREGLQTTGVVDWLEDQLDPAAARARAEQFWGGVFGFDTSLGKAEKQLQEIRSEIEFTKSVTGGGWDTSGMELFYMGLGKTADEARLAATGVGEFTAAIQRSLGILDKQADFDAVEAAFDEARKGFKEFGATLDAGTDAGRQNRENLRGIARDALLASEHLRGLARVEYLEDTSARLAKMADRLGMGEKAAERWADQVLGLDGMNATPHFDLDDKEGRRKVKQMLREMNLLDGTNASPQVDLLIQQFLKGKVSVEQMMRLLNGLQANPHVGAETGEAEAKIHGVIGLLSQVRDKVVHITTVFQRKNIDIGRTTNHADGGLVTGPGGPRDDVIPAMLSNREYIVNAAAVDYYGVGFFDRVNARKFADGGYVGGGQPITTRARGGELDEAARAAKGLAAKLKEAEKALEAEKQQRDALVQKMKSLGGDVTGGLRSDLFGESDPWSSTYGGTSPQGVIGTLRGDIADAQMMRAAIRELKAKGLTGAALAEVLSQGGLAGAQAFSDLSRPEIREYAQAFNQRSRLTRSVGDLAGFASYGGALRESRHDVREITRRMDRLEHLLREGNRDRRNEHQNDRNAQQRGAGNARRNRRRD